MNKYLIFFILLLFKQGFLCAQNNQAILDSVFAEAIRHELASCTESPIKRGRWDVLPVVWDTRLCGKFKYPLATDSMRVKHFPSFKRYIHHPKCISEYASYICLSFSLLGDSVYARMNSYKTKKRKLKFNGRYKWHIYERMWSEDELLYTSPDFWNLSQWANYKVVADSVLSSFQNESLVIVNQYTNAFYKLAEGSFWHERNDNNEVMETHWREWRYFLRKRRNYIFVRWRKLAEKDSLLEKRLDKNAKPIFLYFNKLHLGEKEWRFEYRTAQAKRRNQRRIRINGTYNVRVIFE